MVDRDVTVSQWLCQGTFSPEGTRLALLGLHGLGDVPCPPAGQDSHDTCSHSWATAWLLPAPLPRVWLMPLQVFNLLRECFPNRIGFAVEKSITKPLFPFPDLILLLPL